MNPTSHCRTIIFEEEFKFQYVSLDDHIHIATLNIILTFLSKSHFVWQIWKSLVTFRIEILFELLACMYSDSIGSFKEESCSMILNYM